MKPRKEPMKRTELRRGKPLERKTPMPRTSAKPLRNGPVKARRPTRTAAERETRAGTRRRSGGICERCGQRRACEWHHRENRSQGGDWSLANGCDLCTPCHSWITEHPAESYAFGWSVPHGVTPEQWPVFRHGSWQQPGDRWTACEPHPRQLEMLRELGRAA